MKRSMIGFLLGVFGLSFTGLASAQDVIELDTTTITGNSELPKFLYVVPWQDKTRQSGETQKLVLHNLYGDLFNPVMPAYISATQYQLKMPKGEPNK